MISSRFLAVGFLYIFYTAGLVAADPNYQFGGGNQFCQVRLHLPLTTIFADLAFDRQ